MLLLLFWGGVALFFLGLGMTLLGNILRKPSK